MRGGICVAGGGMKRRRSAVGTSQVRGQNVAGGTAECCRCEDRDNGPKFRGGYLTDY